MIKVAKQFSILGMIAVIAYIAHVVIGGFLWNGYNHITQPISDLTASGAPDKILLSIFTYIYSIASILFAISLIIYYNKSESKAVKAGTFLLLAIQIISLLYGFFPEDLPGSTMTINGIMHIVITILLVPLAIIAPIIIGIGFKKTKEPNGLGSYSIITGIIIFVSGGASVITIANKLPYLGIIERLNIGALLIWMFVLAITVFSSKEIRNP